MSNPNDGVFTLDEQQQLERSQSVRGALLTELLAGQGKVTDSEERFAMVTTILRDMDKTTLGKAGARSKAKQAEGFQDLGSAMAEILAKTPGYGSVKGKHREVPVEVPKELLEIELIEGETHIGVQTVTYQEMIQDR